MTSLKQTEEWLFCLLDGFLEFGDILGSPYLSSVLDIAKEREILELRSGLCGAYSKSVLRLITWPTKFSFSQFRDRLEVWEHLSFWWNQNFLVSDGYRVCSSSLNVLSTLSYPSLVTDNIPPDFMKKNCSMMPLVKIASYTVHLWERRDLWLFPWIWRLPRKDLSFS